MASEADRPALREFFELFKTPWEFHEPGRSYVVLLVASGEVPPLTARLSVVYGGMATPLDTALGFATREQPGPAVLEYRGRGFPAYKGVCSVERGNDSILHATLSQTCVGARTTRNGTTVVRIGFGLCDEVRFLLTEGQPAEFAGIPTLETHIALLRDLIVEAGIPLAEILPTPARFSCIVCLTHDIDFLGIREHHQMPFVGE